MQEEVLEERRWVVLKSEERSVRQVVGGCVAAVARLKGSVGLLSGVLQLAKGTSAPGDVEEQTRSSWSCCGLIRLGLGGAVAHQVAKKLIEDDVVHPF